MRYFIALYKLKKSCYSFQMNKTFYDYKLPSLFPIMPFTLPDTSMEMLTFLLIFVQIIFSSSFYFQIVSLYFRFASCKQYVFGLIYLSTLTTFLFVPTVLWFFPFAGLNFLHSHTLLLLFFYYFIHYNGSCILDSSNSNYSLILCTTVDMHLTHSHIISKMYIMQVCNK